MSQWLAVVHIAIIIKLAICIYSDSECNETDVRLVDGATADEGRVEICQSRVWGSVCDNSWDSTDAKVVCQQLGYEGYEFCLLNRFIITIPSPLLLQQNIFHCETILLHQRHH